ncbi:hypothetical protein QE422_002913 [Chryseobacterium sp. SORGH_AS 447]|uniref:hypothetical protein n=1 Tax=Chryseobacterium sp. SORGH_AS_0447 TaxID=3041769 RepID=UPI00278AC70E|nr:hypothetical protein [Chryseobacterium sp. SORGH_AS_0447]MDQ1162545.1 hypothetical protein [Chryseobacterium sp. SORGH_AS_0447]
MIKKIFTLMFSLSLVSCITLVSCIDDLEIPIPFDVPVTVEQNLPFATVSTNSYLRYPEITLNLDVDAAIKEKNSKLSINNLKSAKLTGFSIEYISSQLGNKLDVISGAKIYIKAPNLPEVLIGTVENNTNPNQVVFNTVDTELIEYFKSKQNSLILEVKGSKSSLDELKVNLKPVFKITLGL